MALSAYAQQLLSLLTKKSSLFEAKEEQFLISKIEKQQSLLEARQEPLKIAALRHLNAGRLLTSRSLRSCHQSMTKWQRAQKHIENWLEYNKKITLEDIINLNNLLSASQSVGFRKRDIYTPMIKHVEPRDLDAIMQYFYAFFQKSSSQGGIKQAFVCRYWICSIHPFADANGRTSQLMADYILLQNGFVPQAYVSLLESLIIADPINKSYMTPHQAFKKFAYSIINAYDILNSKTN